VDWAWMSRSHWPARSFRS